MDDPGIRLAHDSLTLLSTAERLQQSAGDRACAPFLPAALECIEQSLHALGRGCDSAAHAALDGAGPSHERQAQLLASIHDTAAALRIAAANCARTSHLVAETMEAPASMPELEPRRATPKAA